MSKGELEDFIIVSTAEQVRVDAQPLYGPMIRIFAFTYIQHDVALALFVLNDLRDYAGLRAEIRASTFRVDEEVVDALGAEMISWDTLRVCSPFWK